MNIITEIFKIYESLVESLINILEKFQYILKTDEASIFNMEFQEGKLYQHSNGRIVEIIKVDYTWEEVVVKRINYGEHPHEMFSFEYFRNKFTELSNYNKQKQSLNI